MSRYSMPNPRRQPRSAFTLVEVLVVIAIMAILVALIVGITKEMIKQAKIRETAGKLGIIYNLIDQYKGATKNFPNVGNTEDLVTQLNRLNKTDVASLVGKNFSQNGSLQDSWGKEIKYGKSVMSESISADGTQKTVTHSFSINCGSSVSDEMSETFSFEDGYWKPSSSSPPSNTGNRYVDRWLTSNHMPLLVSAGPDESYGSADDIIMPLKSSK